EMAEITKYIVKHTIHLAMQCQEWTGLSNTTSSDVAIATPRNQITHIHDDTSSLHFGFFSRHLRELNVGSSLLFVKGCVVSSSKLDVLSTEMQVLAIDFDQ